jgi:DNA-binding LacI/PurR family transcriptional regulator
MAERKGSVTIGQIARAAGVGTGTVSRVLNATGSVSQVTRARVLDVMRRFEYRPHAGARALARDASRTLGFVMSNRPSMHLYNVTTLNGVMAAASARGYSVLYTHFHYAPTDARDAVALPPIAAERGGTDGLILMGVNHRNLLDRLAHLRIPFVLHYAGFSGELAGLRGGDVVSMDDRGGIEQATSYLLGLGHRRICFVGDSRFPWFRRRADGYRAAMKRAHLPARIEWAEDGEDNFAVGVRAAERLVHNRDRCTAVVAGDDLVMLGILDVLRRAGLRVPADISIVGFGDTEEIRYHQPPPLSTVRAPRFQIGEEMVRMLLSRLEHPRQPLRSIVLPTELVLRDSCARPPLRSTHRAKTHAAST